MHKTGLDRIEINQPNGLTTGLINHHVVDLGVSVNRPALQLTPITGRFQHISPITTLGHKGQR